MSAGTDRLRVLMLARSYPNAVMPTLGLWTERPARQLNNLCDVRVISPVPYCPPGPRRGPFRQYTQFRDIPAEETRAGIRVYHPRFLIAPGNHLNHLEAAAYRLAAGRVASRIRDEFPFDLIHAHFIYPDAVVAQALARRYDVPYVVTDQAPWYPWLEHDSVRKQALAAARDAAALVCVSRSLEESIHRYLPDADVRIIPNGVDPDEFQLGDSDSRRSDQIVFVGFVNYNKGIDVLLDAMEDVVRRRPTARLLVIGGSFYRNTRVQEEELKRRAAPLVESGHVEFLGRRPPAEVARHVRESAVLVLPSRAETFGAVLVEALAAGTPVVATRSGGPEDVVDDTVGRLVDVGDAPALAAALEDVLANVDTFDPQALRAYAVERFSWASVAARVHDLYTDLVEPQPAHVGVGPVRLEPA